MPTYKLTNTAVKNAKPKPDGKPVKLFDGGGLYLHVKPTGKVWRYAFKFEKKQKTMTFGNFPDLSIREARDKHQEARNILAKGMNPVEHRQEQQAFRIATNENSFESVALEWFVKFTADQSEGHRQRNKRRLEKHVFPYIGQSPIAELEPPDILKCLQRIEKQGILETAHRVKQLIGQIFRYAVATGKATRDQTADLKGALPPAKKQNFAAIKDPQEVGELMRAMDDYKGAVETRTALFLSAYLFTRPGELRKMEWSEIDFDAKQWTIPEHKMKARREHIVPLSKQALFLLEEIRLLTGHRPYVFPSRTDTKKPMSDNTVRQALRRLGYDNDTMTAHGFRALASTRLHEMGFESDLIEKQLAHAVGNDVRRAYDRSQHIEKRTTMMQQWADYLDSLRDGATVLPFKAKAG